jgi:hypothetical protein
LFFYRNRNDAREPARNLSGAVLISGKGFPYTKKLAFAGARLIGETLTGLRRNAD